MLRITESEARRLGIVARKSRPNSAKRDELEQLFAAQFKRLGCGMPEPRREHRFHPVRRWRFDFAWPEQLVAVEIEGGVWSGGRHTRGAGFEADAAKYNAAAVAGWTVLRFTGKMLKRDPSGCIGQVRRAIEER